MCTWRAIGAPAAEGRAAGPESPWAAGRLPFGVLARMSGDPSCADSLGDRRSRGLNAEASILGAWRRERSCARFEDRRGKGVRLATVGRLCIARRSGTNSRPSMSNQRRVPSTSILMTRSYKASTRSPAHLDHVPPRPLWRTSFRADPAGSMGQSALPPRYCAALLPLVPDDKTQRHRKSGAPVGAALRSCRRRVPTAGRPIVSPRRVRGLRRR